MPFTPDDLIECYRQGVFPMGEARDDPRIFLMEPKLRGVILPDDFHLPRRLARTVRSDLYDVTADADFDQIVALCAKAAPGRLETWINQPIRKLYGELFRRGAAHSLEVWREGELVGGLYGVSLGGAFFGESMVSLARDASKVALVHLVARLRAGGYRLLDCQFVTDHLAQFGVREIPQADYRGLLAGALGVEGAFAALTATGGEAALQAISQAS